MPMVSALALIQRELFNKVIWYHYLNELAKWFAVRSFTLLKVIRALQ